VKSVLRNKTATFGQESCYGYIAAMLTAGYCLEGKSEEVIRLLALEHQELGVFGERACSF
jgi:hypothetical protein